MKSIKVYFVALVCFAMQFASSQEFRKAMGKRSNPEKRKLVKKASASIECVDGIPGQLTGKVGSSGKKGSKGEGTGKAGDKRVSTGKSGGKGGSTGKSGGKDSSSGKSGKKGRLLKISKGKGAVSSSVTEKGSTSSISSGKGGNIFAVSGKGSVERCVQPKPSPAPVTAPTQAQTPPLPAPSFENVPTDFNLKVIKGTGDGMYKEGTVVEIIARDCLFRKWNIMKGPKLIITDINSSTTTLTMPNQDVKIEAVCDSKPNPAPVTAPTQAPTPPLPTPSFENVPTDFNLKVIKGTGDGTYEEGTVVEIIAKDCLFREWNIVKGPELIIADLYSSSTILTMPNQNVKIEAVCNSSPTPRPVPSPTRTPLIPPIPQPIIPPIPEPSFENVPAFGLTVTKGSGDGAYKAGTVVTIIADDPPEGSTFIRWDIIDGPSGMVADLETITTTVTMLIWNKC